MNSSTQWHLETVKAGQLDPYKLESLKGEWHKVQDWKSFTNTGETTNFIDTASSGNRFYRAVAP